MRYAAVSSAARSGGDVSKARTQTAQIRLFISDLFEFADAERTGCEESWPRPRHHSLLFVAGCSSPAAAAFSLSLVPAGTSAWW